MSDSVRPHRRQPTRLPRPWDSPGKTPGVSCHVLLQCMKVKSESEVAQSCPMLSDPMDYSPLGSSIHGTFQVRVLEWVAISFSNAWKWKVKVKPLSHVRLWQPHGLQPTRLLHPWDFPGKSTGVVCHWHWILLYSVIEPSHLLFSLFFVWIYVSIKPPSVSQSHQEAFISLLSFSNRG